MNLQPAAIVGKSGLTETLIKEVDLALRKRELVKIRFSGMDRDQRDALISGLADKVGAALCGSVGATASYYRPSSEAEDPIPV